MSIDSRIHHRKSNNLSRCPLIGEQKLEENF